MRYFYLPAGFVGRGYGRLKNKSGGALKGYGYLVKVKGGKRGGSFSSSVFDSVQPINVNKITNALGMDYPTAPPPMNLSYPSAPPPPVNFSYPSAPPPPPAYSFTPPPQYASSIAQNVTSAALPKFIPDQVKKMDFSKPQEISKASHGFLSAVGNTLANGIDKVRGVYKKAPESLKLAATIGQEFLPAPIKYGSKAIGALAPVASAALRGKNVLTDHGARKGFRKLAETAARAGLEGLTMSYLPGKMPPLLTAEPQTKALTDASSKGLKMLTDASSNAVKALPGSVGTMVVANTAANKIGGPLIPKPKALAASSTALATLGSTALAPVANASKNAMSKIASWLGYPKALGATSTALTTTGSTALAPVANAGKNAMKAIGASPSALVTTGSTALTRAANAGKNMMGKMAAWVPGMKAIGASPSALTTTAAPLTKYVANATNAARTANMASGTRKLLGSLNPTSRLTDLHNANMANLWRQGKVGSLIKALPYTSMQNVKDMGNAALSNIKNFDYSGFGKSFLQNMRRNLGFGYGGRLIRRGNRKLKKGSIEAKLYMARLRAMRGNKKRTKSGMGFLKGYSYKDARKQLARLIKICKEEKKNKKRSVMPTYMQLKDKKGNITTHKVKDVCKMVYATGKFFEGRDEWLKKHKRLITLWKYLSKNRYNTLSKLRYEKRINRLLNKRAEKKISDKWKLKEPTMWIHERRKEIIKNALKLLRRGQRYSDLNKFAKLMKEKHKHWTKNKSLNDIKRGIFN